MRLIDWLEMYLLPTLRVDMSVAKSTSRIVPLAPNKLHQSSLQLDLDGQVLRVLEQRFRLVSTQEDAGNSGSVPRRLSGLLATPLWILVLVSIAGNASLF